nr:MAG TPA: Transcriptional regulator [Caudoviricetes sp.]
MREKRKELGLTQVQLSANAFAESCTCVSPSSFLFSLIAKRLANVLGVDWTKFYEE